MNHFDPAKSQRLGTHSIQIDGDSIYMVSDGILTLDDMTKLLALFKSLREQYGACFIFYDSRKNTGMESAARKLAATSVETNMTPALQVGFGAPFMVRVLIDMLLKAQKLMNKTPVSLRFFESEDDAWAFFDAERNLIRNDLKRKAS